MKRPFQIVGNPVWTNAANMAVLCDDERHLGHIVQAKGWHAFDGTKMNEDSDSYRYIGAFPTKRQAKDAVEGSVETLPRPLVMMAG